MNAKPSLIPVADNTAGKQQRGRPYVPGQSGNPLGRPKGSRNKTTIFCEALMADDGENIARKIVGLAKEGNSTALRICAGYLMPRRDRLVQFELPPIDSFDDIQNASKAVVDNCAQGSLSPIEAGYVMRLLESHFTNLKCHDVDERLAQIERKTKEF